MMLFFDSAQTHTGLDDANFTCWLLKAFVDALIRRREGKNDLEFYRPPSREWDRGDGPARKRRPREEYPGPDWMEKAAAAPPWSKAP